MSHTRDSGSAPLNAVDVVTADESTGRDDSADRDAYAMELPEYVMDEGGHAASPVPLTTLARQVDLARGSPRISAPQKIQLHELAAENATLKARLKSTTTELKQTRDLYSRSLARGKVDPTSNAAHQMQVLSVLEPGHAALHAAQARSASAPRYRKENAAQTMPLRGLKPLSKVWKAPASAAEIATLTGVAAGTQTSIGGRDCIVMSGEEASGLRYGAALTAGMGATSHADEVRRLKAEVLRSHAECASLQHAVQVMRRSMETGDTASQRSASRGRSEPSGTDPAALFGPETADAIPNAAAADGVELARDSHLTAMDRIAMLNEALKQANGRISDLEKDLSGERVKLAEALHEDVAGAPSPFKAGKRRVLGSDDDEGPKLTLNKGTLTEPAQIEVALPSGKSPVTGGAAGGSHATALEQALTLTRAQLSSALDEVASLRQQVDEAHAELSQRKAGGGINVRSIAVMADTGADFAAMFRAHGLQMDESTVESLLHARLHREEMLRDQRRDDAAHVARSHTVTVHELQANLETARNELVDAHRTIDELRYALDLEKRERFNPHALLSHYAEGGGFTGGDHGAAAGPGSQDSSMKQASAEIAFVCDTLAATKSEAESLAQELQQAVLERDAALASFKELKARSEDVLRNCHAITESARADADQAVTQLTTMVRQKDNDIFSLRGQTAALNRDLDKMTRARDTVAKEAETFKQRVATVQMAMSKLREDANAQAVQLRELRAQQAAHASSMSVATTTPRSAVPTPRGFGRSPLNKPAASPIRRSTGRSASAEGTTSIQALQAALDARDNERSSVSRLTTFGGNNQAPHSPVVPDGVPRAEGAAATPEKKGRGRAAAADSGMPSEELQAEYEELRTCFLALAAMTPAAQTAREVTTALTNAFQTQREHTTALETELRKRTTMLQALKKDLTAAKVKIEEMERANSQVQLLESKLTVATKQAEKTKKALSTARDDKATVEADTEAKVRSLEAELEETRDALMTTRQELLEGRSLMMNLIGDDDDVIKSVARSDGGDTDTPDVPASQPSRSTSHSSRLPGPPAVSNAPPHPMGDLAKLDGER